MRFNTIPNSFNKIAPNTRIISCKKQAKKRLSPTIPFSEKAINATPKADVKTQAKALIRFLLSKNVVWIPLHKVIRLTKRMIFILNYYRHVPREREIEQKQRAQRCQQIFENRTVLNGPFKGMRYPSMAAAGSELYPKLLGSYEQEIQEILNFAVTQSYSAVVDIGCGEGYYAVGMAMKLGGDKHFAFDIDPRAQRLCKALAKANHVNVKVGGLCDGNTLRKLPLGDHALIFSDCEGYELELIDKELGTLLKPHDLIIETHDIFDISTTQTLLDVLCHTHDLQVFPSVDDREKAYTYDYPELEGLDLNERHMILQERPVIMKWIFAKSRLEQLELEPLDLDQSDASTVTSDNLQELRED